MATKNQLNVRLPDDWYEVLESAAFFERQSMAEFARQLLESAIGELAKKPHIVELMTLRARVESQQAAELQKERDKVKPLDAARSKRGA